MKDILILTLEGLPLWVLGLTFIAVAILNGIRRGPNVASIVLLVLALAPLALATISTVHGTETVFLFRSQEVLALLILYGSDFVLSVGILIAAVRLLNWRSAVALGIPLFVSVALPFLTFHRGAILSDLREPEIYAILMLSHLPWIPFLAAIASRERDEAWISNETLLLATPFGAAICGLLFCVACLDNDRRFPNFIQYISPFYCVLEGTPVDTPEGPVPIEQLHAGSEVTCRTDDGRLETGTVTKHGGYSADAWYRFSMEDGRVLEVTGSHPLLTADQWVRAEDMHIGAPVVTVDGDSEVTRIEKMKGKVTVYDISVSPYPNFFANGVCVHNKIY